MQWTGFRDIETSYLPAELTLYQLGSLNNIFTLEPFASFRFSPSGVPWLDLELQGSFATVNQDRYIRGGFVSLGLVFSPGAKR
jgi:hypothetical protein